MQKRKNFGKLRDVLEIPDPPCPVEQLGQVIWKTKERIYEKELV